MLDHFHRAHDIEQPRLLRQRLDRRRPIGEARARLLGMMAGGLDRGGSRIDADDVGAKPRQRLGEQAGPAADIEQAHARERQAGRRLSPKCRAIRSRAQAIRTGFRRWSGAIGPSSSHHASPSASKRATSSDMMLADGPAGIATFPCLSGRPA